MNAMGKAGLDERGTSSSRPVLSVEWRLPLLALGLGVLAWVVLFRAEILHAISTWESSTTYNHCWLILPISIWLAWERRHRLTLLLPAPAPWFALLALPATTLWLVAERMGIMEGRQFAAMGMLYVLVLACLGWRVALAMAAPLAYLVFLVPFGAFTVPMLQTLTAHMVDALLDLTSIPHYVDALLIEIPEGFFYVAEACAGLRFIIAALAFGALYALVMFRSPGRRIAVMVLALAVPVLANGVRAFGLVVLGHWWGSAAAVDADHLIYGWGFFSLVIVLLILAGLPFREDQRRPLPLSGPSPAGRPPLALAAAVLALGFAAAGPSLVARLDAQLAATPPLEVPLPLTATEACEVGAGGAVTCQGTRITAQLMQFAPRVNWDAVSEARRRLTLAVSDTDMTYDAPLPGGGSLRARNVSGNPETIAVGAWLDGRVAGDGLRSRATQALHALRGDRAAGPVLLVIELRPDGPAELQRDRAILLRVLEQQGEAIAAAAASLSLGR